MTEIVGGEDLNNRHLFFHRSGGWKSKRRVPSGLVSGEASLLARRRPPAPCALTWPPFRVLEDIGLCCLFSSQSYQTRTPLLWLHLTFIISLQALSPNVVTWALVSLYEVWKGRSWSHNRILWWKPWIPFPEESQTYILPPVLGVHGSHLGQRS